MPSFPAGNAVIQSQHIFFGLALAFNWVALGSLPPVSSQLHRRRTSFGSCRSKPPRQGLSLALRRFRLQQRFCTQKGLAEAPGGISTSRHQVHMCMWPGRPPGQTHHPHQGLSTHESRLLHLSMRKQDRRAKPAWPRGASIPRQRLSTRTAAEERKTTKNE